MKNLQRVMSRGQLLLFGFINSGLIMLFSIAGCSDPSHTGSMVSYAGSMLTPGDVDDYLISNRGGTYCIQSETDSSCIDLVRLVNGGVDTKGPIFHIYPERTRYLFYHEGKPIVQVVRAERIGDDNNDDNGDDDDGDNGGGNNNDDNDGDNGGGNNNDDNDGDNGGGNNNDDNGDDDDNDDDDGDNGGGNNNDDNNDNPDNTDPTNDPSDGHGWLIWIYYPEGTAPINPPTLSKSDVTVTINGKQLTDADITGFAQFIGSDGERGIQFFYPTESAELLDLKVQMDGITDSEGNVRFNINYLWYSH